MTDISSLISTLWSKVSTPIPNILIGTAFLLAAPDAHKWFGWIFIAIGAAYPVEAMIGGGKKLLLAISENKKIRELMNSLNREERALIRKLVSERHQTFSTHNNGYYSLSQGGEGGRTGRHELLDTCTSLHNKGILVPANSDTHTACYTVSERAWRVVNKLYKKNREFFSPVLYHRASETISIVSLDDTFKRK